jgi:hypothetical protein
MSRIELLTSTPLLGLQRAEADLDRELTPVLPQPVQVDPGPHRPDPRRPEEVLAEARVVAPESLRHKDLDQLSEQFVPGVPEQPLSQRVDQDDFAGLVDDHHGVRRRFQQPPELRLGLFPLGDVADGADDVAFSAGRQGAEADFDGEFRTVLAEPEQLATLAHRPDPWLAGVGCAVGRVVAPEALRDEHLDRLPEQFVPGIPEHSLGLGVHQGDPACLINQEDGVGGRLQQAAELLLFRGPVKGAPRTGVGKDEVGRLRQYGHLGDGQCALPDPRCPATLKG